MKLNLLIRDLDVGLAEAITTREIAGVCCDSRQVKPGYVFVAIPGVKQDGRRYIEDAVKRGAAIIVTEPPIEPQGHLPAVPQLQVQDAREALARMAATYYGNPSRDLEMVGVTGTNGKTTTVYMIRDLLRARGRDPGVISTVQYEIGKRTIPAARTTPAADQLQSLLAQMVGAGCGACAMEVSSHALDQKRTLGIDYDVAVFTNLTRDHLDYHGSMEDYFHAKALLFRSLGEKRGTGGDLTVPPLQNGARTATAVINADDDWGGKMRSEVNPAAECLTYGLTRSADVRASELDLSAQYSAFTVDSPWGKTGIRMRLLGRFNVSNALAAFTVGGVLGLDTGFMSEVLSKVQQVPGRLQEFRSGKGFLVFVDYAHTDDALANVLKTLREITSGRLWLVFGCGGDRDRSKRPAMGAVAERYADHVVLTSDNPRSEDPLAILDEIRKGMTKQANVEIVADRREAIESVLARAAADDVVLVAGKGHENFQEFANKTVTFDDRQVVREILEESHAPV